MRVRALTYLLVLIIISSSVQAFGISFPYLANDTIKLYPGQGYLFKLTIQNKDQENMTVDVTVDSPIANLVGESQLEVPGETYDTYVFFNITIPKTAKPGDTYDVNYAVSPVGKGEGQIPLVVAYSRSFKVLVIESPAEPITQTQAQAINPPALKPSLPAWLLIPLIILVLLTVGVVLWKKSHQMSERISKPAAGAKPMSQIPLPSTHSFTTPEQEEKTRTTITFMNKADDDEEPEVIIPRASQPMQEITSKSEKEEKPAEKIINPHHYFHLRNGKSLKDLEELYSSIKDMNDDEFKHHVNPAKNDFANWAYHILEKKELANKLFKTTNKVEILGLIKDELDKE